MKQTPIHSLLVICILLVFSFTSCISSQKVADYSSQYYGDALPKEKKTKKAGIEVINKLPDDMERIAKGKHVDNQLLPLLFYWKIDREKICTLNNKIPAVQVSNATHQFASRELMDKLKGRKLELYIEEAPRQFSFRVLDEVIIVILVPVGWTKVSVKPDSVDLKVRYRLLDGSSVVKEGVVIADNAQRDLVLGKYQSWKKAQSQFLDDYNANLVNMTKDVLEKLNAELASEPNP
ncbi:MAG: hypothetical protein WBP58_09130 [Chitinophagaceae bacterium]